MLTIAHTTGTTFHAPPLFRAVNSFGTLVRLFVVLLIMSSAPSVRPAYAQQEDAPVMMAEKNGIEGQYIVVFEVGGRRGSDINNFVRTNGADLARASGGKVIRTYGHAIAAVTMQVPNNGIESVRRYPGVLYIEQDQVVSGGTTQNNATWGIDRSDQHFLPLDGNYNWSADGAVVNTYVIDSGIRLSHNEFEDRANAGFTAINDGWGTRDCNGHGTHVAGTIGSSTYGVAKNTELWSVRVLDCNRNGTVSTVLAGIDWVVANVQLPAVANMSLGGGSSTTLDDAVRSMINSGVSTVVSAGNDGSDACLRWLTESGR